VYFFFAGWNAILTVRSRWGNRGNSQVDGLRWSGGEASVDKPVGSHFFHDGGSFKSLKGFGFIDGVRRGGSGVILR